MLMYHPLWFAAAGLLIGFALWSPALWKFRRSLAIGFIIIELLTGLAFILSGHSMLALIWLSVSAYKVVNLARIRTDRIQQDHLRRSSLRAELQLSVVQAIVLVLAGAKLSVSGDALLIGASFFSLITGIIVLASTLRHLRTTKTSQATKSYTDNELPTLSVLVPARNETIDLEACLLTLTASNYPKLEIIVLDDCSQTKRTPEIIRSFAHAGVRFIAGRPAEDSWLAKNYAYHQLAEAASGDYLLFCGVDVRMNPGAMRELITTMLEKQKTMLSVLPRNARPNTWRSLLIQPMRYAWELSLPRRMFSRPPVLSTCWIIERAAFHSAGGFKATSRSILPESHFARTTARQDGFSFLRSDMLISDKLYEEQQATAIRMRYPQLRRRLELVWLLTSVQLVGLVLPIVFFVTLQLRGDFWWSLISLLAFAVHQAALTTVTSVMYGRPANISVSLIGLHDIILLNYSMYKYEFSEVNWKDRNVCLPVMRIETNQPGLALRS